jgi:hypothetical protein
VTDSFPVHPRLDAEGGADEYKFRVELSQSERDQLDALLSGGRHATCKIKRAQILVAANDGLSDEVIAATLKVSGSMIYRTKRRFVEANLEGALSEEPRPGVERKLSRASQSSIIWRIFVVQAQKSADRVLLRIREAPHDRRTFAGKTPENRQLNPIYRRFLETCAGDRAIKPLAWQSSSRAICSGWNWSRGMAK